MPSPLRVAYTLEQCWHDVPGGTAVATLEVARRMVARDDVELVGVSGRHRRPPRAPFAPPIPVRQLPVGRPWLYEAWNRLERPSVERAVGAVDVCHSTIAIPASTRAPHVVTVHDVAFVHAPDQFSRHGVRVMTAGLERCRRADLILCPSNATKTDLVDLGFSGDRVRVVPWGVAVVDVSSADIERVRARYELPRRFVLFVGTVEPRKNLARLASAVAALDDEIALVVAGSSGWGDAAPSVAATRFLGFVPADDLAALYGAATVFAYPSLREGFGMPVAEAMAQGVPVVTSRGSATEEVAGGAAVLADPLDADSIADALTTVIAAPERWIEAGSRRAATLTWEACVDATVAAYRTVAR